MACTELRSWHRAGHSRLRIFANLSRRQLQDETLVEEIAKVIDELEIAPSASGFELTENLLMGDPDGSLGVLKALRGIGVGISLDDFGTGFSSISLLKNAPIHALQIDHSLVRGAAGNPDDAAVVRAIITMDDRLMLMTIAEGIESKAQRDFLPGEDCSQAQGGYCSPPLTSNDVWEYLQLGEHTLGASG